MENEELFGGNERALEQDIDRRKGGYGGDYFDENEHRAGQEKYDLATGERYKNDGDVDSPHAIEEEDIAGLEGIKQEVQHDLATKLLLENGYDEFGNEKKKAA